MAKLGKIALTGLLATTSQAALAQSAPENATRIEQLEARLELLAARSEAQQAEIAELREQNNRYEALLGQVDVTDGAAVETGSPADQVAQAPSSVAPGAMTQSLRTQSQFALLDSRTEDLLGSREVVPVVPDGGMGTPGRREGAHVGITAAKDGGRVAITLTNSDFHSDCELTSGMTISRDDPCNGTEPVGYQQRVTTVGLSAPAATSGDSSFATLDGLASGFKLELRHTLFSGNMPTIRGLSAHAGIERLRSDCLESSAADPQQCTELNGLISGDGVNTALSESIADFIFEQVVAGSYGITLNASVGYDEFSYFPDTTFTADTAERVGFAAGVGFIYFPTQGSSLLFEGNVQRSFEAPKSTTRCRPMPEPGNDFLTCATGVFALPEREERLILSTQYRRQFHLADSGLLPNVAIGPRIEFDALSDDYAIDFPVYLVSDPSGMNAGVRFGYENEDSEGEFKIGVFYGTTFDLTPF